MGGNEEIIIKDLRVVDMLVLCDFLETFCDTSPTCRPTLTPNVLCPTMISGDPKRRRASVVAISTKGKAE
jgi:hypothetical protein